MFNFDSSILNEGHRQHYDDARTAGNESEMRNNLLAEINNIKTSIGLKEELLKKFPQKAAIYEPVISGLRTRLELVQDELNKLTNSK